MASVQNIVQNSQTRAVQHNHVVIKYQQPPDPAIINHVLEILVAATRSFSQKNLVQIPYIQDYIDQIIPFLLTLYSESAQRVLQQGVPPPVSNTIYLPPACNDLQQLFNELSSTQSTSLRAMTPLNSNTNIEQTVQPPATSQADRIIEIETSNIYSVNKVLLQQILETVGQITSKAFNRNPQQVRKLEPLVLELYRQLTCFLFSLEAEENQKNWTDFNLSRCSVISDQSLEPHLENSGRKEVIV